MHRSSPASSHVAKVLSSVGHGGNASALISSWRRCVNLHRLVPDAASIPERHDARFLIEARQHSEALLRVAASVMDQLLALIDGTDHMVFLTDAAGTVLETRTLRTSDFWERPKSEWAGTDFSEASNGTNGIGTVLKEKRPLTIFADEHFHVRNITAVCSGAPIFGTDGHIAGCIDVSSSAHRTDPIVSALMLEAVVDAARRIEIGLLADAFSSSKLMLASRTGQNPGAVLAVDSSGGVVGATRAARVMLEVHDEHLNGTFTIEDLWEGGPAADLTLASAEHRAIEIALARYKGNATAAAKALGISRSTLLRKVSEYGRDIRPKAHHV